MQAFAWFLFSAELDGLHWKHVHKILMHSSFVSWLLHLISPGDFRTCYWKIYQTFCSMCSVSNASVGLLALHTGFNWFHICNLNSCRCSEGSATDYWWFTLQSAEVLWPIGHYGIDCVNEVAYLFPVLLVCPQGMLRPDRLKATAWDHSLGVAGLLG